MPSQKGKRPKGVQMTEHQTKIPQIIDIVEMPPTADIVQMPATQDIVQIPPTQVGSQTTDTAHIEDILQMAAQFVYVQPLKRALGGNIYLVLTEWNGSKRVDLRFWKDDTVPTKEGVSLHIWINGKPCATCQTLQTICVPESQKKKTVEWRYHIGDDVFVTIKAPFPFVHISKHSIHACDWTYRPTKRGVALHFGEWKELKHIIPCWKKKSQN